MRRSILGALLGLLAAFLFTAPSAEATYTSEGCTPGYWKNHPKAWKDSAGKAVPTSTSLNSAGFSASTYKNNTLLTALGYNGGTDVLGAERILLRAAVAAWLNDAHPVVDYPYSKSTIVGWVNAAISSKSRAQMLHIADKLDKANNLGCPL